MKKFLYFLTEDDGRFLAVKNGVVTSTTIPTPLKNTPDGWSEKTLAWERDMKMLGLVRQLSLPFGFVTDAAKILRKAFFSESVERKLFLIIAKLETEVDLIAETYNQNYKKFYRGEIDNTSFKNGALKIEANVTEGGLHKLFNASKSTQYEYPLSEGDALVKMDGIFLEQKHSFLIPQSGVLKKNHFLDVYFINKEGEGAGIATLTQQGMEVPFGYNYTTGTNFFLTTTQAINGIKLEGEIKIVVPYAVQAYTLYLQRNGTTQNIQTINNLVANQTYTIPVNLTINAAAGEKFYLNGIATYPTVIVPIGYFETNLRLSVKSKYRTTHTKAYTPLALYKKLIKSISGSENNALSTLLEQYSHLKLTSGDGLRCIEGAKIKTNLNDFFEFCYVLMFGGLGIEGGKIVIEHRSNFLKTANPVALGEVKDLLVTEAADLLFNTIRVGYNQVQIDSLNGKYAFNEFHTYKTDITRITKELTLICPYTADPFAIESIRINLDGKTTTDDSKDNQVFIIDAVNNKMTKTVAAETFGGFNYFTLFDRIDFDKFHVGEKITVSNAFGIEHTYTIAQVLAVGASNMIIQVLEPITAGLYNDAVLTLSTSTLYRSSTMAITGVPDPATIFNIRLSPKRILLKWMDWINSILCREAGSKITFLSTDKNADLVTVDGSETIIEKGNLTVGTTRYFLNYELSFEGLTPSSLANILEAEPNRPVSFTWNGITYVGFIRKAGMAPNDEKEQTFKLLSAATNDFKNLIHE